MGTTVTEMSDTQFGGSGSDNRFFCITFICNIADETFIFVNHQGMTSNNDFVHVQDLPCIT